MQGGGHGRENRQAVSTGKICYRRGNAMWQLSIATAGGSGLKFAFACFSFLLCVCCVRAFVYVHVRAGVHVRACVRVSLSVHVCLYSPCIW